MPVKNIKYKDVELNDTFEMVKELLKTSKNTKTNADILEVASDLALYLHYKSSFVKREPCDLVGHLQDAKDHLIDISVSDECMLTYQEANELEKLLTRTLYILIEEQTDGRTSK